MNTQTTATKQGTRLADIVAVGFIGLSIVAGALAIFFFLRYGKPQPPPQLVGPYPAVLDFQNFNVGRFGTNGITASYLRERGIDDVRSGGFSNPWEIVSQNGNNVLRTRWQYANTDATWYFDPDRQYPTSFFKLSLDFRLSPTWQGDKRGGGKHMFGPKRVLGLSGSDIRFDFADLDGWDQASQQWTHQNTMKKATIYSRHADGQHQERNWNFGTALPNNPTCTQGYNACFIPGDWYTLELTVDCNLDNNDAGTARLDIKKGGQAYRTFSTTLNDFEKQACREAGGVDLFRTGNYDIYLLCNGGAQDGRPCATDVECRDPDPEGSNHGVCNREDPRLTPENTWFELDNITMQDLRSEPPLPICTNGQQITEPCLCGGHQQNNGYCCNGVWQSGQCPTGENQPPTSRITNPQNNATVSGTIDVTATADDPDGTIDTVQFYLGEDLQAEDTEAPYSWTWATSGNGQATLRAIAVDDQNASSPVVAGQNEITVTIENETVLFQDNFNDGNADGWMSTGANWSVTNSGESSYYYRTNFAGAGIVYANSQAFESLPFAVTTRVKKILDGGFAALMGFYRTETPNGNYLLLADFTSNKLKLQYENGQTIQEADAALSANQWYVLKMTFSALNGVTGTIRLDGAQTDLASVSSDALYPYPTGTIALQCNNSGNANNHCRFDDVTVLQLPPDASQPPPQGGTFFSDDFNDGNASGWSTQTGSWTVQNNEFRSSHTDNTDRYAWADSQTFSALPFDLKVKTKLEAGVGPIGIATYRTSNTNQYRFVYIKTQQKLYLYKGTTTLASLSNLNLPITNWHWMKLSMSREGSSVKLEGRIWADGTQEPATATITATDATPLAVGTVGLYCRDTTTICRFDDATVTGTGGTTPGGSGGQSPVFLKIEPSAPIE